jgi:hypothetical protein
VSGLTDFGDPIEPFDRIIEEPNPYETLQAWERFLKRIEGMKFAPNAVPPKAWYLGEGRDNIARLKASAKKYSRES